MVINMNGSIKSILKFRVYAGDMYCGHLQVMHCQNRSGDHPVVLHVFANRHGNRRIKVGAVPAILNYKCLRLVRTNRLDNLTIA